MYYSDRVTLISRSAKLNEAGQIVTDAVGNPIFEEKSTEVWGDITSPSRSESTSAGVQGLRASAVVTVHTSDYNGQTVVVLNGDRLAVYRTYKKGEDIELYVTEQKGVEHGQYQH